MAEINTLSSATQAQFDNGLSAPHIHRGSFSMQLYVKNNGGALGSGQSASVRTATTAAMNAAIVSAGSLGKFLEIEPNTYEISGNGLLIPPATSQQLVIRGGEGSIISMFGTAAPVLTIGDLTGVNDIAGLDIKGLTLEYGANPAGAANTNGISMGSVYSSFFEKINIAGATGGSPYNAPLYGWRQYSTNGTHGYGFQNRFTDIYVNQAVVSLFSKELGGTGDEHINIYLHNGSGSTSANTLTGAAFNVNGNTQRCNDKYTRFNVEWCSTPAAMSFNNSIHQTFHETHIEGFVANGYGSQVIALSGAQALFDGIELLDWQVPASQGNTGVFSFAGYGEAVDVRGLIIKVSTGSEIQSSSVVFKATNNQGNDTQPIIHMTGYAFLEGGSGNATNLSLDAVSGLTALQASTVAEYWGDALMPRTRGAQFAMTGALPIYGCHEDPIILAPANLSAAAVTLKQTFKASGTGSSATPKIGSKPRFRRQSGTVGGAITIVDEKTGTTLYTNSTAAADLVCEMTAAGYVGRA